MSADYARLVAEGRVRVAVQSGEVAGLLVLLPRADHLLLDNVAVHPRWQGRGLGRLLLEEAEAVARAGGHAVLRLYTNEVMAENLALYRRLGYRETHRAEEDGFRRVHMAKDLA
jgi:ribosomal protein S18 acetylase RimI-like enzyme